MAKKSSAAVGTWVGVAVAIVGLYLTYKWLTKPRATSSLPSGFVGGAYGGGNVSPYGSSQSSSSNALSSLLKGLQSLFNGKKSGGGGLSFGSGGGSGSGSPGSISSALQDQISAISGFSTIANNMPLAELGGYSLANYDPEGFDQSLIAGDQIPYQPTSLFDLSGMAFSPGDLGSLGGSSDSVPLDYSGGLDSSSIPYEPLQNFDLSGMSFSPGGDLATVPSGIGVGNLSDSYGGGGASPFGFGGF